ncbi:fungal-specific transcription factor domain-containing protein [Rhexocercosporidium sp. MPI-PUGE-AT-0058]|nr:fungal-specific transcription factor domain-containing protein [Rhexocercosporidium sp. MPI-PUGE-AT-0058]
MQRRSRKGCIDCKRAKVKCDEEQPHCGTCKRRGYACQGYAIPPVTSPKHALRPPASPAAVSQSQRSERIEPQTPALIPESQWYEKRQSTNRHSARDIHETPREEDVHRSTPRSQASEVEEMALEDSDAFSSVIEYTEQQITLIARARANSMQLPSCPPLYPTVPDHPPDAIGRTDQPGVEIYFSRHPRELVMSKEFVDEMNANVLQVFNQDPAAVGDTLSAIGHIYLGEGGSSIVPMLDRRQRILARLRDRRDLEQMMIMLLGLCALEQDSGLSFSSVAKYFIRALARQDMMISLTYARHPLIPNAVWLSDDSFHTADRFMGYTVTLMPILADLEALAEEMRGGTLTPSEGVSRNGNRHQFGDNIWSEEAIMITTNPTIAIYQKVLGIRQRLNQWRPVAAQNVSFQASRNLLLHAHSHRAAALLYLDRLLEPPGSSEAANQVALGMAQEVLMHLSAMTDQLKTSLWPVLIAGTELTEEEDRTIVMGMFEEIIRQRKTVTARRSRDFCVQRVWRARDLGLAWNWMDLVEIYPGECLPI